MAINGITTVVRLGARGPSGTVLAQATLTDHETRLDTLESNPVFTGTMTGVSINLTGNSSLGNSASDTVTMYRIETAGNAPAFAAGAAMGSSPGAQTITGNDTSATIIQNAGTSTTTGVMWTVTFANARPASTYRVLLQSLGTNAAGADLYVTNRTVNGFDIGCRVAPTASTQVAVAMLVIQ